MSETETNENRTSPALAYSKGEAARVLGMSRTSLWREITKRKIFVTSRGKIPHAECSRYLTQEMQLARSARRPRLNKEELAKFHKSISLTTN